MYGYTRPLKGELKVREFELFRSVYCGLCHTLKKRYGFPARFALNYDFTFLTMLLADDEFSSRCEYRRCSASPFRKRACAVSNKKSELAADYSMILAYYKLLDTMQDEHFFHKLYIWPVLMLFKGRFKKACVRHRAFSEEVRCRLAELTELEQERSPSVDLAADKFALILEAASNEIEDKSRKLATGKLLYHIGRIVYILDAFDDIGEDQKAGRYNPLKERYGDINEEVVSRLRNTLNHSASIAAADFELLSATVYTDILKNIIYLGIPNAIELVLKGEWRKTTKRLHNQQHR
ncbi:MAG: hypothetical protein GX111_08730 [Clostridiales bacterium]|jgi:hypothetical protein|nr:hypothetical protein [Clostridiales bacterium]